MRYSYQAALLGDPSWTEFVALEADHHKLGKLDSIQFDVRTSTLTTVEHLEDLSEVLNVGFNQVQEGLIEIDFSLRRIGDTLQSIESTLYWGFSEVIQRIDLMQATLDQLLAAVESPTKTWAYEQFDLARDAFERGWFSESLNYLETAINGHSSSPGFPTEPRFHFLRGTILLGENRKGEVEIVDPAEAERAYLCAAKYAEDRTFRMSALVGASKSAGVQGDPTKSLRHAQLAVESNDSLATGHFALAKAAACTARTEDASSALARSISIDPTFYFWAVSDPDIRRNNAVFGSAEAAVCENEKQNCDKLIEDAKALEKIYSWWSKLANDPSAAKSMTKRLNDVRSLQKTGTFACLLLASREADEIVDGFRGGISRAVHSAQKQLDARLQKLDTGPRWRQSEDIGLIRVAIASIPDPIVNNESSRRHIKMAIGKIAALRRKRSISSFFHGIYLGLTGGFAGFLSSAGALILWGGFYTWVNRGYPRPTKYMLMDTWVELSLVFGGVCATIGWIIAFAANTRSVTGRFALLGPFAIARIGSAVISGAILFLAFSIVAPDLLR